VYLKPVFDVTTITGSFTGSLFNCGRFILPHLNSTCDIFKRTYCIKTIRPTSLKWSISGSSGPNGSPAYSKWIEDTYAVLTDFLSIKLFMFYWTLPIVNREHVKRSISDTIL